MMQRTPLQRKTPLRRSGFGHAMPAPAERPEKKIPIYHVEPGAWRQTSTLAKPAASAPIEKHEYVRSKKLREAYRQLPCGNCGRQDGTVCCAHSNWAIHGKGASIKADDSRGAALCAACHVPILDQGSKLSRAERQAMWWDAHVFSVRELVRRGLWPKDVAVPDIETNPWEGNANGE